MTRFCTRCGAPLIEGNRFCVKCGQPIAQAAPPEPAPPPAFAPPVPPTLTSPAPPSYTVPVPAPFGAPPSSPPPPPVAVNPPGYTPPPPPPEVVPGASKGSPAGLVIGLVAVLVILGGAGFWFYSRQHRGDLSSSEGEAAAIAPASGPQASPVAATPLATPSAPATPPQASASVAASTPPVATAAAPPANIRPARPARPRVSPDPEPTGTTGLPATAPVTPEPSPLPAPPHAPTHPTAGILHYTGPPVPQNGEVVFDNLPAARLRFTFDRGAWQPVISRKPDGTQRLTLRSLKPGLQTHCDVAWEIVR